VSEDRSLLIESLWRDARHEGEEIVRAAEAEAERASAQAKAQAEAAHREARERSALETAPEAARIKNRARHAAAGRLLVRQKELLDALLTEVEGEVAGGRLPEGEVTGAIEPLLAELLEGLPEGASGVVTVRPPDRAPCKAALARMGAGFTLETDPAIPGGARLVLGGGCETRDNTLSARLRTLRDSPPIDLFRVLFPSGAGGGGDRPKG